ncbi:DUF3866 family protein [Actinobacteria bacterium YIM 96077]|uniref:DUF3866 domain-containing protein n=1 Tax=Phytoactinopolyspora halophila TaxID=1981511 RepID=A0A329R146_9ACTN|nr:DUF3866 family protein [Phytoactinopolyspora halophila]AYY15472.1 DUF3866 family protein [Actinobacteria bacterium YIM 96077]RAW17669.1 DUF3866 domain-containing protein [Phytoactinopolyspora halophila]
MIRWRNGVVRTAGRSWPGALELDVETDDGTVRALAYTELVGEPEPGDRVLLNVNALALGLGTGGYAQVVAIPDRLPADPPPTPGHLMKARYTPLQATVLGVDEQNSPWYDELRVARDLADMPVVTADLHSALPAVVAGARDHAAGIRVAYVMTDGGALPLWFSRSVAGMVEAGWLAGTVTVGQAFGGDIEAVTLHTGLLAARHVLDADIAVVAQGPGNLGTGTAWGFSGVACGEAVNAVATLGGRPVGSLRISEADARPRHHGVSHHSMTAYGKVALAPADVVVPDLGGVFGGQVNAQVKRLGERHTLVYTPVDGLDAALRAAPVHLSTMGRGVDEDTAYFLTAAAAGRYAATLAAQVRGQA